MLLQVGGDGCSAVTAWATEGERLSALPCACRHAHDQTAHVVMANIVMAYVVMAHIVMAHVVMALAPM